MQRNRLLGDRDRPNRFVETEKAKNHCYSIIFDVSQNHKINKINKWTNQKVNRNQIILLIVAQFIGGTTLECIIWSLVYTHESVTFGFEMNHIRV